MGPDIVYRGFRRDRKQCVLVLEGGHEALLGSGDFAWGAKGRATEMLALNILLHALGATPVFGTTPSSTSRQRPSVVRAFARDVLETLPQDGFALDRGFVLEWAESHAVQRRL